MAKKAYIGVDGVARKIKKGYVGVDGTARKIKKAYIGIGGVARPCWSGGELAYYGTITPLSDGRNLLAAAANSQFAVFGPGRRSTASSSSRYSYAATKVVDAYDASLTRTVPQSAGDNGWYGAAAHAGELVVFAGGSTTSSQESRSGVTAYDASLTKTTTQLGFISTQLGGVSHNLQALFAGGIDIDEDDEGDTTSTELNQCVSFNSQLTRTTLTELSEKRHGLRGVQIGDYALFGGGIYTAGYPTKSCAAVDTYDRALTKGLATDLSVARSPGCAVKLNEYALFCGGSMRSKDSVTGSNSDVVDVYNESLTRMVIQALSQARSRIAATVLDEFAILSGGRDNPADIYDVSLTRTTAAVLSASNPEAAAVTIGNYALFGGGIGASPDYPTNLNHSQDTVEAVSIN